MESPGEIVLAQLREGNMGAQGYFMKRVDLMLTGGRDAEHLLGLMAWGWAAFKEGIELKRSALGQSVPTPPSPAQPPDQAGPGPGRPPG